MLRSHKDEAFKDDLESHLSGLKNSGLIETWNDGMIMPGEDWEDQIRKHLETSQIILFLISANFMGSNYINDVEIKHAMERHQKDEIIIIPIIIKPCDWNSLPISKFQALPRGAKPISQWPDHDEAYLDVVSNLKRLLNNIEEFLPRY